MNPNDYQQEIKRAAVKSAKAFGDRFDWEDIAQAICLDMLEHPKVYSGVKPGSPLFMVILKRTAMRWGAQECAKFLKFGDQTIYSSEELKRLLPKYYDPGSWPNGLTQPSWDDYEDVEEFKAVLEEWANNTKLYVDMLDVEYAVNMLSTAQRNIIQKKYRDGEKLASKYEMNLHGEAMRYLTYHVNHRVEDKETAKPVRRVVSNYQAISLLDKQEEMEHRPNYQDGLTKMQITNCYNHPAYKRSPHVTNSPWRA